MSWIENKWLKRRFIYEYRSANACVFSKMQSNVRRVVNIEDLGSCKLPMADCYRWDRRLREGNTLWAVEKGKQILAYAWMNSPTDREVWHDSLPTEVGEIRIFDVWTDPLHRGQGLAGTLYAAILNEATQKPLRRIWAVVESSNYSSIRLHEKSGFVVSSTNWLIKFWGCNVFSVIPGRGLCFLIGVRRNRL